MMEHLAPYMAPGVSLQDAIREAWIASIPEELRRPGLSDRDRQIIALCGQGLSQRDVAERFGISQQMVGKIIRRAA